MKTNRKYQPNQPEDLHSNGRVNRLAFVSRIVNTENRPLSVKEAWTLVNKREAKRIGLNQHRFGAALSAAVRGGRIDKTRIQDSDTKTTVSFHPLNMKPMGLDIPVPLYTRDTTSDDDVFNIDAVSWETIECGNCDATFTIDEGLDIGGIDYCRECYDTISAKDDVFTFDDDEANECWKCGSIVAMEDTVVEGTKSFCSSCAIPAPEHSEETGELNRAFLEQAQLLEEKKKREGFTVKHNKEAADSFDPDEFVKKMTEQRDAIVSTIQHHFTAEQLLDTLHNLNPDLHDDVLVAIYQALGKPVYIGLGSLLEPEPRKTEHMTWAFVNGNLVVKQ